jgi:ATP-dependent DNA ligase
MKTLAELKAECTALGLTVVENGGRASKEPYISALRDYHWRKDHPDEPLPPQVSPMLLGDWGDLDVEEARRIEQDEPGWIVQPKLDGVRALFHIEGDRIRITSRCVSEVTYRLGEFQDNLPHLTERLSGLAGTILDGELIFPTSSLDTGHTVARHPLQAAMAIISTSPDQARQFQSQPENRLRFHAFDILKYRDADLTHLPLRDRLDYLTRAIAAAGHPYLEPVPSYAIGRLDVHRRILEAEGEGTVWKRLDKPYEPGRRVRHWLKRKRKLTIEAFVIGSKPGSQGRGNQSLVGAVEFGVHLGDGSVSPIGWVSSWTDAERRAMTHLDPTGRPKLNPDYLGRRALITGQDAAARSGRLRHARHSRWLDWTVGSSTDCS